MRRILKNGGLLLTAMLSLASCSEENPWSGSNEVGGIDLVLSADCSVTDALLSGTRGITGDRGEVTPEEKDFKIRLSKIDGTLSKTFGSLDDFKAEGSFPIGTYDLDAFIGDINEEGFEKPHFIGTERVTVKPATVTPLSVTASLANAMVGVEYSDNFLSAYPVHETSLTTTGSTYVTYTKNEHRYGYVKPGLVNINVTLTNAQGKTVRLSPARFEAQSRHRYNLRLDVSNSIVSNNLVLNIIFNDAVTSEVVEVNLTDELFDAPAPVVSPVGFADGELFNIMEGDKLPESPKFNVINMGGLKEATLNITSTGVDNAWIPVWGEHLELIGSTAQEQASLAANGVVAKGFFRNPDKMAVLDLSAYIPHLPEGSHTFSLVAMDNFTRVSEPVSFTVNVGKLHIDADVKELPAFMGETMDVYVTTNSSAIKDRISFRTSDKDGAMHPSKILNVEKVTQQSSGDYEVYKYTIAIEKNETIKVNVDVYYDDTKVVKKMTVDKGIPDYNVQVDPFAKKVYFKVTASDNTITEALIKTAVILDDDTEIDESRISRNISDGIIEVDGLSPSTTYSNIRMTISSASNPDKKIIPAFTTETATEVPNGGFDNVNSTYSLNMDQGGDWTITNIGNPTTHQTTVSMNISEPQGWATNNAISMSGNPANTWFKTPCVYSSNLEWTVHQPEAKVWNQGQTAFDETPDIYKDFAFHSGKSVIIRNVAWDPAGTVPDTQRQTGNFDYSNYYNNETPSCSRKVAGKLFLGSYSYSGSETIKEGVAFASRPMKLKGFYRYVNDDNNSSEKGVVKISLWSGTTVIASGELSLEAASTMTAFEVPLKYTLFTDKKPTQLKIMITSSDKSSEGDIPVTAHCTKQEQSYRGAELTIDDLSFEY